MKTFVEHLYDIKDVYLNINDRNPEKNLKALTVFDGRILDMLRNET